MKTNLHLLAFAAAVLVFRPTEAQAETLLAVDWGGNYFNGTNTGDVTLSVGTALTNGVLFAYSDSVPKMPTNSSKIDYSVPSARFYGAYQLGGSPGGSGDQNRLQYNSGQNVLHFISWTGGTAQGMIFWKKSDFLNGLDARETIGLDALQSVSIDVASVRATSGGVRIAVESGGNWYLSEAAQTYATGGTPLDPAAFTFGDLGSLQWAQWSISSSTSPLNPEPTAFNISGSTLNDITAIGFYFNVNYTGANRALIDVASFEVAAIPEGRTTALTALAGGVAFVWWQRARRGEARRAR